MFFNLLPDKQEWIKKFLNSDRFSKIKSRLDQITVSVTIKFDDDDIEENFNTPRQNKILKKILDLQPFYVLDYINEKNNNVIYDVGCGYNFFKDFYPVIGIDPDSEFADIKDEFNDGFIFKNQEMFENAISINAIHFCQITDLENRIIGFFNCVKRGGYAYLAINMQRVLDITYHGIPYNIDDNLINDIDNKLKNILTKIDGRLLFYENIFNIMHDEPLNGNIKILIER